MFTDVLPQIRDEGLRLLGHVRRVERLAHAVDNVARLLYVEHVEALAKRGLHLLDHVPNVGQVRRDFVELARLFRLARQAARHVAVSAILLVHGHRQHDRRRQLVRCLLARLGLIHFYHVDRIPATLGHVPACLRDFCTRNAGDDGDNRPQQQQLQKPEAGQGSKHHM